MLPALEQQSFDRGIPARSSFRLDVTVVSAGLPGTLA